MAATLVGGAFLNSALNVLFDRLTSPELINFFRGQKRSESLLDVLKLKLLEVNKVLNDAEDKQITDPAVKRWLDELKHVVYHAEDLVDEIATKALRCKVEAEYQSGPNQKPWEVRAQIQPRSRRLRIIQGKSMQCLPSLIADISRNAAEKIVQLCQSLDNRDFNTALQIQGV